MVSGKPGAVQSEADSFYGNPRSRTISTVSPSWYRNNIKMIKPPFAMKMQRPITHFPVHKKCADAFSEWLDLVWGNASADQRVIEQWGLDIFSGSFCFRPMRGLNHLSMHAYGCAIDFDAPRNSMNNHSPHFATLRAEVIEPFIKLGGVWGGDWNGNGFSSDDRRPDGMHFQFAKMG
jgi:D-alanyl-D-alanine carboxypeptidase